MNNDTKYSKYNKRIQEAIDKDDKILFQVLVNKFNDKNKLQPRYLFITEKYIYNVKPHSIIGGLVAKLNPQRRIKRKISIANLYGITISRTSKEFVIHVSGEYDYRYQSDKERDQIIEKLCFIYQKIQTQKMPIYFKDDMTLIQFTTSKQDQKQGIIRIPKYPIYMDQQDYHRNCGKNFQVQLYPKSSSDLKKLQLEDFFPLKVLGQGGFGKIILCRQKSTGQIFAIKSLQKSKILGDDLFEYVKTERDILIKINHPFLINLQYAFTTPEKLFFVLPFIGGGDLFQLLTKFHQFPEEMVLFYATQIVMGIGHLHSLGYVYHDLKPENILLCQDGYIKIADFGLSKKLEVGQRIKLYAGTLEYISPEMCSRQDHDFVSDWWSLGILIYELLFGITPFESRKKDRAETLQNILSLQPEFIQNIQISAECQDLISKLLTKNPSLRLGCKGEKQILCHPWFQQINQDQIFQRKFPPIYLPSINGETDVSNFSCEFTYQNACFSVVNKKIEEIPSDQFGQMSYYPDNLEQK